MKNILPMASVFATWPLRYTASLIYVIRRIQAIQEGLKFKWYTLASNYAHVNPLNAKLNPICHLLALLGAHPIFHVSWIRVNILDGSLSTIKKNTEALVVASNCG